MSNPWLKCKYCGHEFHAATLEGGMIDNHNCKDRQIADLKERCQSLAAHAVLDEQEIANLNERLTETEVARDGLELALKMADDCLEVWRAFWDNMRTADRQAYEDVCSHAKALKDRGLI